MDVALDDLITRKKTTRSRGSHPRRGSGRAQILGTNVPNPTTRARAAAAATATAPTPQPSDKIIVSNLPMDVNEAQIKELFSTTVGPLREVNLHHDANGKSKGVAAVHFQRKGDGSKAYQQYNNRLIDGKRPMKIEIVVDPSRPAPQSLVSRVAPAANGAAAPAVATTRGSGRGGRGGRRKGAGRAPKTAADLDAEMEDYTSNNAPAAAAAPAAVA